PTGVAASPAASDSITVSWNPVPGAQSYDVYRTLSARTAGIPVGTHANGATVSGTSFTDTGLAPSTTYYYVVTAFASPIHSALSAQVQATTSAASTTVRVNVGGGAYTSSTNAVFSADTGFSGGATNSTSSTISGTNDPALYR